jgi:hypothetical protein
MQSELDANAVKLVREAWRNALENGCADFLNSSNDEELALDMSDCDSEIAELPGPELMRAVAQVRAENA